MVAKQSRTDSLKRLESGRCPIHGLSMLQVDLAHEGTVFVVACPRKDCKIQGHSVEALGLVMLTDDFTYLLS